MRTSASQVPSQLHSIALRYRHPLRPDPIQANGHCRRGDLAGPAITPTTNIAGRSTTEPASKRDDRLRRIEAILLLSREPLSSRRLCQYANLADATEARTLVRHLNDVLDASGRAFRVEEVAGGYQLLTRPKFASWLRRLASVPKEMRLSAPALETLSVIAYRQPAGRAEIEAVRGVNCGEIVRQLLERDLVRIAGRSNDLGRPYLYATTRRFLQLFGLKTLDDLPRAEQLRKQDLSQDSACSSTNRSKTTPTTDHPDRNENEEDFEVTATIRAELSPEDLRKIRQGGIPGVLPRASDEDELDDEVTDDDDDLDDLDDEDDDDFEDDEDDDEEEFDEVDDEEGFEDEEWEEVDDDEEDLDDEDDDDDWDDDEDDDEEEEEEEADWE
jgi:segregation and condensation protein B